MNRWLEALAIFTVIFGVGFLVWRGCDRVGPWVARYHQTRDAKSFVLNSALKKQR